MDFQLLGQYFPLLEKQGSTTTAAYTYGNELVRMNGESRQVGISLRSIPAGRWQRIPTDSHQQQPDRDRHPLMNDN